jgi:hypothetical protein
VEEYGGVTFREGEAPAELSPKRQAHTVGLPFAANSDYFTPSEKPFMINFRVADLDTLLAQLRREGVKVDERTEKSEFGLLRLGNGSGGKSYRTVGAAGNPNCFAVDRWALKSRRNSWLSPIFWGLRSTTGTSAMARLGWRKMGGEGFEPPTYWV